LEKESQRNLSLSDRSYLTGAALGSLTELIDEEAVDASESVELEFELITMSVVFEVDVVVVEELDGDDNSI